MKLIERKHASAYLDTMWLRLSHNEHMMWIRTTFVSNHALVHDCGIGGLPYGAQVLLQYWLELLQLSIRKGKARQHLEKAVSGHDAGRKAMYGRVGLTSSVPI